MGEEIKRAIENGDTEFAIETLLQITMSDERLHQDSIILAGRFRNWEREFRTGQTTDRTELHSIQASILETLDLMKNVNTVKNHSTPPHGYNQKSHKEYTVFISYSHKDKHKVDQITTLLHNRDDIRVWYDDWEIRGGDRLIDRIKNAIDICSVFVLMLSKNSVESNWVKNEISEAFDQESRGKVKILPVQIEECDLPLGIKGRLYIDFSVGSFDSNFKLLVSHIKDAPLRPPKFLRFWLLPHGRNHISILFGSTLLDGTLSWSKPAGSQFANTSILNTMMALGVDEAEIDINFVHSVNWELIPEKEYIYAIGSHKVNPILGLCLANYEREHGSSDWFWIRDQVHNYLGIVLSNGEKLSPTIERAKGLGNGLDYGLILWIPSNSTRLDNKKHKGLVCCLAGCHTGATQAAAIAATNISIIEKQLIGSFPAVHSAIRSLEKGIWAVFRVETQDFRPITESITILEAGTCKKKATRI